jgi:hypothetical protein
MPVDFIEVRKQVGQVGKNAPGLDKRLRELREQARQILQQNATELDQLKRKVEQAREMDPFLRCAKPAGEPLNARFLMPPLPEKATILAADGSQINPDRHAPVDFYLINVATIEMRLHFADAPKTTTRSSLYYGLDLYTQSGIIGEDLVALKRDQSEREELARLAEGAPPQVITLTDGPIELWGGKAQSAEENATFTDSLKSYQKALTELYKIGVATGGYVDKPRADLVVQLLEVACTPLDQLRALRENRPLRGVTDTDLYRDILGPGERSAVFAMQSKSAGNYRGELALHFFYLNVGRAKKPWLARVEIPAWVCSNREMLDNLHAVLVHQTAILGARAYPYILHRAHELAIVSHEEKDQITAMLVQELTRQGVFVDDESQKQAAKDLPGAKRYKK